MPTRIDIDSDGGVLIARDASVSLPSVPLKELESLETETSSGRLFVMATEDPSRFRIDLYTADAPPAALNADFQPLGGTFLLHLPTGRLVISGASGTGATADGTPIAVPAGSYLLTVLERRSFDGRRHDKEMIQLLGEADWKFHQRANWVAAAGCLPMLAALITLLLAFRHGRWLSALYVGLPLAVLAALPHVFHRASRRYRRIDRMMNEHEAAKPLFVLRLAPAEQTSGLAGGLVRL